MKLPRQIKDASWSPMELLGHVLKLRERHYEHRNYGPCTLVLGGLWDQYLDELYTPTSGYLLRDRLSQVDGILEIKVLWKEHSWSVALEAYQQVVGAVTCSIPSSIPG